ncbi:MAG: hypothetical protein ACI8PG_004696, partial [Planctomycetota bacterium]
PQRRLPFICRLNAHAAGADTLASGKANGQLLPQSRTLFCRVQYLPKSSA